MMDWLNYVLPNVSLGNSRSTIPKSQTQVNVKLPIQTVLEKISLSFLYYINLNTKTLVKISKTGISRHRPVKENIRKERQACWDNHTLVLVTISTLLADSRPVVPLAVSWLRFLRLALLIVSRQCSGPSMWSNEFPSVLTLLRSSDLSCWLLYI